MTTHRRAVSVPLYPGEYEQRLAEAFADFENEARKSASAGQARFGQRSAVARAARTFDDLREHPPEPVASVTLHQVGYLDWDDLVERHPARDGNAEDAINGVDMSVFPRALLHLSLVSPDDTRDIGDRLAAGEQQLRTLSPSHVHYRKLVGASWNVNNEALDLPKESLASLLIQQRSDGSEQQN
ncbi:hypothetical protein QE370_000458 [Aeromicrobium sp. SORGH_AS981]|uniref:hypothetical protein n=1 Tax=Aeromicrobium sp. SORGH_AS_0981 TaxID=3041802 RepID=UPI0028627A38|nr:hypothetical protein [Aeromicrobium sp. SORGH_AS_0981]MDR6117274.1 hypothetical protein [Aeromicrobium sp. SORGH_AS_0981]